jgi:O-antigen chain-terminating methyltransferase
MADDPAFKEGMPEALRTAISGMEALVASLEREPAPPAPATAATTREPDAMPQEAGEIMQWVRADLAARALGGAAAAYIPLHEPAGATVIPWIDPGSEPLSSSLQWPDVAAPVVEIRDRYEMNELLGSHDAAFLRNAFRAIMHREPDPGGYGHFQRELEQGRLTRLEVLAELRYSPEGRQVGTKVPGLARVNLSRKLRRVPVLGTILALAHASVRLASMARRIDRLEADLIRSDFDSRTRADALRTAMAELEARRAAGMAQMAAVRDAIEQSLGHLREHAGQLHRSEKAVRAWAGAFGEGLSLLRDEVARQSDRLAGAATRADMLEASRQGLVAMHAFGALGARLEEQLGTMALVEAGAKQALLRVVEMDQSQRDFAAEYRAITDALARDLRERLGSTAADTHLDAFYAAFEDRFRGTREDIRARVAVYVEDVRAAHAATGGAPVVDIGSGRGEWLEVLRDAGIAARGVDPNEEMVRRTREARLEAVHSDGLRYLRTLAPASLSAVTGFHVIEHLQFADLVSLFAEALRVLKPGGMILFETPNPENLAVGAHTFWYDPTHVRPLPAAMVEYLAQSQGFARVEVRRLHPSEPWEALGTGPDEEVRARLNAALYGARDYAVIAYKP